MTADVRATPFDESVELETSLDLAGNGQVIGRIASTTTLPGQPGIPLTSDDTIHEHLQQELSTPDLDRYSRWFALIATQSSSHIAPLSEEIARGRNIVLTEDPEMHLVWYINRLLIKPLPSFLLSHAFWTRFLGAGSLSHINPADSIAQLAAIRAASIGYLRTFYHLIKHDSDFRIAQSNFLIPQDTTRAQFCSFIAGFQYIDDAQVSPRYHYGTLRLHRLNAWAFLGLHRTRFRDVHWDYNTYFTQFYGPLLFAFAIFSVILNAMSVGITAGQSATDSPWLIMNGVNIWFGVGTILLVCLIGLILFFVLCYKVIDEAAFALRARLRKTFA